MPKKWAWARFHHVICNTWRWLARSTSLMLPCCKRHIVPGTYFFVTFFAFCNTWHWFDPVWDDWRNGILMRPWSPRRSNGYPRMLLLIVLVVEFESRRGEIYEFICNKIKNKKTINYWGRLLCDLIPSFWFLFFDQKKRCACLCRPILQNPTGWIRFENPMAQVVRFWPKSDDSTHRIIKSTNGFGL